MDKDEDEEEEEEYDPDSLLRLPDNVLLETIGCLGINDLINVASTNRRLLPLANRACRTRYGKVSLEIEADGESEVAEFRLSRDGKILDSIKQKNIGKYLSISGNEIHRIDFDVTTVRQELLGMYERLLDAISKHATSVTTLQLTQFPRVLRSFLKPLTTVENLLLINCELSGNRAFEQRLINDNFPNIKYLHIINYQIESERFCDMIQHEFPKLKKLHLTIASEMVDIPEFRMFLQYNPQIERFALRIGHQHAWELVEFVGFYNFNQIKILEIISNLEPPSQIFHFNKTLKRLRYTTDMNKEIYLSSEEADWTIISDRRALRNVSIRDLYYERNINQ